MKPPKLPDNGLLDEFKACAFSTECASRDAYALNGNVPF